MQTGTPAPATSTVPDSTVPDWATDALAALRAASARVAELGPPPEATAVGTDEPDDHAFDAGGHATRFEELHEALSAVLDELDRA